MEPFTRQSAFAQTKGRGEETGNREKAARRIAFEPVLPFVFVLAGTSPATNNVAKVYLALMVLKPQVDNVRRRASKERETQQSVSLELMKREEKSVCVQRYTN